MAGPFNFMTGAENAVFWAWTKKKKVFLDRLPFCGYYHGQQKRTHVLKGGRMTRQERQQEEMTRRLWDKMPALIERLIELAEDGET